MSAPGPLVRMRALLPSELPAHPDLSSLQGSGTVPELSTFMTSVLNEAETFMTTYMSKSFTVKAENKPAPPSKASVKLLEKTITSAELPKSSTTTGAAEETWFARSSTHENASKAGSANWSEFEYGLLDDHSAHEMDYTPDVFDAHRVLSWDDQMGSVPGYEKPRLSIFEMAHKIPPPLNNRVFCVAVATATAVGGSSFLVVQIPVDITRVSKALYANGRNRTDGDSAVKKKAVELGQYVSIERCELLDEGKSVQWQMGTASDARGVLPMWVQKMAVPGAIVKDVSYFMEWIQNRRQGKGNESGAGAGA